MKTPMPPHQRTIATQILWFTMKAEITSGVEELEAMFG